MKKVRRDLDPRKNGQCSESYRHPNAGTLRCILPSDHAAQTHVAFVGDVPIKWTWQRPEGDDCEQAWREWCEGVCDPDIWHEYGHAFKAGWKAHAERYTTLKLGVLALADEMEDANAERGTMPGVRMKVRREWAKALRVIVNGAPMSDTEPNVYGEGGGRDLELNVLLDKWEAEIDEQTKAGEYGIAEGLRIAANDLLAAARAAARLGDPA